MFVKCYMSLSQLESFYKGEVVIFKPVFTTMEDIEMTLNLKKLDMIIQNNGILIKKKSIVVRLRKLFKQLFRARKSK